MTTRILEAALHTSPVGEWKPRCKDCSRRHLCRRISRAIEDIQLEPIYVWDIEHRLRFRALLDELVSLGFEYPDGIANCEMQSMQRTDIMSILCEAQDLLLDVKQGA